MRSSQGRDVQPFRIPGSFCHQAGMGEPAAPQARVAALVQEWTADVQLVNFAATGHLTKIGKADELDRKEVVANVRVLKPLIQHLGPSSMEAIKHVPARYVPQSAQSTQVSGLLSTIVTRRWRQSCSTRGLAAGSCRAEAWVSVGLWRGF